ncbi:MAG: acetoacetate--CoA ligase [Betaproteobacteria bacterium]|nr:MAG: acetoacetate--CoA ligase [Betaproteobacteria bacterium]
MSAAPPVLWQPSKDRISDSNIGRFIELANQRYEARIDGVKLRNSVDLYKWSVREPEQFWNGLWDFAGVVAEARGTRTLIDGDKMPGAKWFPDARLNYAQNLLRRRDDETAIVFWGEDKIRWRLTFAQLYDAVAMTVAALKAQGVGKGDRVAAFMPNTPDTIIFMLAVTSIGAVWSSCSPDFGTRGVLDRFGQIEPVLLFAVEGYYYNGKVHDTLPRLAEIASGLPSVKKVVIVSYTRDKPGISGIRAAQHLEHFVARFAGDQGQKAEIAFEQVPFNHPLFILYSSGTTGVPKCIVHGAGGTLLQHLKEHQLHTDLKRGDRLFYFTTCGWMMWNWLVSGLASGATLLLYDGAPTYPSPSVLFDLADEEDMTIFGTSAKYIDALNKAGVRPAATHRLESLKTMTSTGSPLVPEGFDYVYGNIKKDLLLASISGGTDIVSCFVLGDPTLPVYRGEIQRRGFGMQVQVFNDEGQAVIGEKGELVCTGPFPSMPIYFWNDDDGAKYRAAYFSRFPGVWCHGDFMELTERGTAIIYGRSDATLNPGGVRIGTAEIYRQVEQLDEVIEGLVIGQEWDNDVRVVLFVRLRDGVELDEQLVDKIRTAIRRNATPRHVPAKVLQVVDIPRTKSGKIVELAVRNVVHGAPVKNLEALANPEALEHFRNRPELRS